MVQSDRDLALEVLQTLRKPGAEVAVLGGLEPGQGDMASVDVDVVVDGPPKSVLRAALPELRSRDLRPVMLIPTYPGSLTVVVVRGPATTAAHVELHHDLRGRSPLGLRTGVALAAAVEHHPSGPFRTLPVAEQALYRLRKAQTKGQTARQRELLASPPDLSSGQPGLFAPHARRDLRLALREGKLIDRSDSLRRRSFWLFTRARWIAQPPGFWVEFVGDRSADEVARLTVERFEDVLVTRRAIRAPSVTPGRMLWYLREVVPLLWRAGLVATSIAPPGGPGPHLTVPVDPHRKPDEVIGAIAASMASRVAGRLR